MQIEELEKGEEMKDLGYKSVYQRKRDENNTVRVTNIPDEDFNESDLTKLLVPYGQITRMHLARMQKDNVFENKGFAFVR